MSFDSLDEAKYTSQMFPPPFPFPREWRRLAPGGEAYEDVGGRWLISSSFRSLVTEPPDCSCFGGGSGCGCAITTTTGWQAFGLSHPLQPQPLHPNAVFIPEQHLQEDQHQEEQEPEEYDGEYEYGYVLNDEWRERFVQSMRAGKLRRPHADNPKSHGKKPTRGSKAQVSHQKRFDKAVAMRATCQDALARELRRAEAEDRQRQRRQQRLQEQHQRSVENATPNALEQTSLTRIRQLEAELNSRFDSFCDAHCPVMWPSDPL